MVTAGLVGSYFQRYAHRRLTSSCTWIILTSRLKVKKVFLTFKRKVPTRHVPQTGQVFPSWIRSSSPSPPIRCSSWPSLYLPLELLLYLGSRWQLCVCLSVNVSWCRGLMVESPTTETRKRLRLSPEEFLTQSM